MVGVGAGLAVTSTNEEGVWTAAAEAVAGSGRIEGSATFAGPTGKARQMGVCLFQRHESPAGPVACEVDTDCALVPASVAEGGGRYCVAPGPDRPRFCYFRPGSPSAYCAGSPALEGATTAAGTYRIEVEAPPGSEWITVACFEACAAIPPATSSTVTVR